MFHYLPFLLSDCYLSSSPLLSLSSTDHFFSCIHSSILSKPTTIRPLSFGSYRIPSVWLTVNDQCRITPSPPKEKKREKEKKRIFFLLSTYVWVGFDTTDWLSGIFIWWSCKNHHDHPPHQIRESPRRRSLKCQVCDWLVVKGSKDTYILTSLNDGPLRSLMLPFVMKQPIATATICSQRMNDAISLLQFHSDCSFFLSFLRPWIAGSSLTLCCIVLYRIEKVREKKLCTLGITSKLHIWS